MRSCELCFTSLLKGLGTTQNPKEIKFSDICERKGFWCHTIPLSRPCDPY